MQRRHLRKLMLPAGVLAASLIGSAVAVSYQSGQVQSAEARRLAQAQALASARARLANAGVEKDIITRFSHVYDALQEVGFVGDEQRLNWIDGLRTANREANLFGVEYRIGQQETFAAAADLGTPGLPMRQSTMHLRLSLLHEGDLMNFFHLLAARRVGVFTLDGCALTRLVGVPPKGDQPQVNAECDLTWITVEDTETGTPGS